MQEFLHWLAIFSTKVTTFNWSCLKRSVHRLASYASCSTLAELFNKIWREVFPKVKVSRRAPWIKNCLQDCFFFWISGSLMLLRTWSISPVFLIFTAVSWNLISGTLGIREEDEPRYHVNSCIPCCMLAWNCTELTMVRISTTGYA